MPDRHAAGLEQRCLVGVGGVLAGARVLDPVAVQVALRRDDPGLARRRRCGCWRARPSRCPRPPARRCAWGWPRRPCPCHASASCPGPGSRSWRWRCRRPWSGRGRRPRCRCASCTAGPSPSASSSLQRPVIATVPPANGKLRAGLRAYRWRATRRGRAGCRPRRRGSRPGPGRRRAVLPPGTWRRAVSGQPPSELTRPTPNSASDPQARARTDGGDLVGAQERRGGCGASRGPRTEPVADRER